MWLLSWWLSCILLSLIPLSGRSKWLHCMQPYGESHTERTNVSLQQPVLIWSLPTSIWLNLEVDNPLSEYWGDWAPADTLIATQKEILSQNLPNKQVWDARPIEIGNKYLLFQSLRYGAIFTSDFEIKFILASEYFNSLSLLFLISTLLSL